MSISVCIWLAQGGKGGRAISHSDTCVNMVNKNVLISLIMVGNFAYQLSRHRVNARKRGASGLPSL
jgi:hypothetical protein